MWPQSPAPPGTHSSLQLTKGWLLTKIEQRGERGISSQRASVSPTALPTPNRCSTSQPSSPYLPGTHTTQRRARKAVIPAVVRSLMPTEQSSTSARSSTSRKQGAPHTRFSCSFHQDPPAMRIPLPVRTGIRIHMVCSCSVEPPP